MDKSGRAWLIPLTGVAFVALVIIAFAVGGEPPDVDDGAQKVVDFYSEDEDRRFIGAALACAAATLFIFFAAYLKDVLRRAEGGRGSGVLPTVMFAGVIIFATGVAIDSSLTAAMAETAEDIDPASVQALAALFENDYFPFALGLQLFFLGLGLSVVRYGALPKWMGFLFVLLGVIALTPIGFISFLGGAIVVIVVSVLFALRDRKATPAAGSPT